MNLTKIFGHVTLVFGVTVVLRTPSLFVPYYNIDELTNGIFANFILEGRMTVGDFLGNTYIATHYLYALIFKIFGQYNLFAVHGIHMIWVGLTAVALYFSGYRATGKLAGGLSAGLAYGIFSISAYSKDFQSALSESFSLLPAVLASAFFFGGFDETKSETQKRWNFFLTGLFIGFSALFKAPAGIMIVAVVFALVFGFEKSLRYLLLSFLGLFLALALPFVFAADSLSALSIAIDKFFVIKKNYIQAYDSLPFIYWFTKYVIRTLLISLAVFPLWFLSFLYLKENFIFNSEIPVKKRIFTFFIFVWLVCDWFVVALGKRVFFHYFVFMFPPLCLLTGMAISSLPLKAEQFLKFSLKKGHYGFVALLGLGSVLTFLSDGFFRWSLKPNDFPQVTEVIQSQTDPGETIYVWGLVPQLYFFSQRMPASTMIWADLLAGFSTGSPAMEYMRSSGKNLSLSQSVIYDLQSNPGFPSDKNSKNGENLAKERVSSLPEKELLSIQEILEYIEVPQWKKLFEDFFNNPPKLFLDTSPTGVRGFSQYPVEKYDLLKKFLQDNYTLHSVVDGIVIYRLK